MADFKSEWPRSNRNQWPTLFRNRWPTSPGIRTPIDGSEPCERLVFDHDVPPITRATTTLAVPVLALTGATSYWASVVASPPGHMSGSGARGTGDLWQLPASWPARPIYDANRPSGV